MPDTVESRLGTLEFTDGHRPRRRRNCCMTTRSNRGSLQHRRRTALRLRADHQHRSRAVRDKDMIARARHERY